MSDWAEYKLGDVTEWSSGGTPSKADDTYWNGDIPWISASSMSGNRYSTSDRNITLSGLNAGSKLAKKDTILLLVRGSILHQRIPVGIADRDVSFNQDVKGILAKREFLEPWFLLLWFMANEKKLLTMVESTGIGAGKLDTKQLQDLMIKIPPIKEREKITSFGKSLDSKITLNRQINQTLEAMAQALFKSWFVDFEPVKAKLSALAVGGSADDANLAAMSAISGKTTEQLLTLKTTNPDQFQQLYTTANLFPSEMVDSELGDIPKGWEVGKVGDIVERLKSKKSYTKNEVLPFGNTPVFEQGAGLLLGFHNEVAGLKATPEEPLFIFGDHTCVMKISFSDFDISSNVIPLKGKGFPTAWVYHSTVGKQEFQEYRRHWSEFVIQPVFLPTKDVTIRFSSVVTELHLQIESLSKQCLDLSLVRDTLLPKLLAGELL